MLTMAHHLKQPWARKAPDCRHFFCAAAGCDVVYFAENGKVFRVSDVRTAVGTKDASDTACICYCFGVSRADAWRDSGARDYVLAQTENRVCACDKMNPSGRCCLKDFPRGLPPAEKSSA